MKETWRLKFRTTLNVVFIWLMFIENVYSVEPSWMGMRKFNGEATGIIRDIKSVNEVVYIGAENGLFKLVGSSAKRFSSENSPLGKGYITNLHVKGDSLFIAEFGNGVFNYSMSNGSFARVALPEYLERKAWAVLPIKNTIFVSTLSKIVIIPDAGKSPIIKDSLSNGISMKGLFSLTKHEEHIVASELNNLIFFDEKGNEKLVLNREEFFPALSKITYTTSIGSELFVGGVGGVYRIIGSDYQFYPIQAPTQQLKDVECIIRDSRGKVWVAAGGLFVLDEAGRVLKELPSGKPRYSFDQIRAVQSIHQLANEQFLIASTQLGLIALDLASPAINYLHETNFPFRKDIYSIVPVERKRYLARTSDRWLSLDPSTGKLSEVENFDFVKELIPLQNQQLFTSEKCSLLDVTTSNMGMHTPVTDLSEFCPYLKNQYFTNDNQQFIYYEAPTHAGFVRLDEKKLSHFVNAPKDLRFLLSTGDIPLVILDKNNALYFMVEPGVWVKHELKELSGVYVYCMYADSSSIYLCTSGKGMKRFELSTKQLTSAFAGIDIPRFIRAGFLDQNGNHWLATNKGFMFIDEVSSFEFDSSDGIVDTDFNYRGILPLNRSEFLLVGDQLSYLIETNKVKNYIERRRRHYADASIVKVQVSPGADTKLELSPKQKIKLPSAPDEIIFEFASADYLYPHLHKLEYRLMGFHEEWQELPTNIGTVAYSGLGFGDFDFQTRVVDSKSELSQPISRYPFAIAKPLWFSWQAFFAYLSVAGLMFWLVVYMIKRHLAEKSRVLAAIIHQKQSALMESNRSITALLNKKERLFDNLAAEIKTPVMQILNPLAELRTKPLTSAIRADVESVFASAGRLRVLMDQLAAVQRIEHISGQILQSYDVGKTLDYLVETLRPQATEKQLVISLDCSVKQAVLLVQDSLEAMINNLLLNAITYTQPQGHIKVKASGHADRLLITVSDNGPGMSRKELDFVLSRFAQGANHSGKEGMGIGLNLTNELALANEGWLEIYSQEGLGTSISVHLPIAGVNVPDEKTPIAINESSVQQVKEERAAYEQNDLPLVLVIERSQEACEYLISLIGERYNCYSVQNGTKALEIVPVLQPDIIISELKVPGLSGIAFTERLREVEGYADLPVIILTAVSDHGAKLESFKASVNDYLVKPVYREELLSRIESNLTLSKLAHIRSKTDRVSNLASDTPAYVKHILPRCSNDKERKFVVKFLQVVEANYRDENFNRASAAVSLAVSERQLNRLLARLLPDNFTMFLKKFRLEKSMPLLERGLQITQIALEVGFGSAAYYSRCFKQVYGCLPSEKTFINAESADQ